MKRRIPPWSWELPRHVDLLWSKGIALHCDHRWTHDYWHHDTEQRADPDFFARHWDGCRGLVYVRLGSGRRDDGCPLDLTSFAAHLSRLQHPIVLVSTDGDRLVPSGLPDTTVDTILNHPLVMAWFTQNWDGHPHSKLHPLPIGLDLHSRLSRWNLCGWWGQSWLSVTAQAARPRLERRSEILLDAHPQLVDSDPGERRELRRLMEGCSACHILPTRLTRPQIWREYARHQFVLSPAGLGLDCHRTWEALLLGAIPIVRTSALSPLYQGLPIVEVDRWEEALDPDARQRWLTRTVADASVVRRALSTKTWVDRMRTYLTTTVTVRASSNRPVRHTHT